MAMIIMASVGALLLPRVVEMTNMARGAAFSEVRRNFESSVNQIHFQWVAQGGGDVVILEEVEVHVNSEGWPTLGDDWKQDTSDELWAKMMRNEVPEGWALEGSPNSGSGRVY